MKQFLCYDEFSEKVEKRIDKFSALR